MGVPSSYTRCVVDISIPILKSASLYIIIHNFIQELCLSPQCTNEKLKSRDIQYSTEVLMSVSYIGMITGDNNSTHFDSFLCHSGHPISYQLPLCYPS